MFRHYLSNSDIQYELQKKGVPCLFSFTREKQTICYLRQIVSKKKDSKSFSHCIFMSTSTHCSSCSSIFFIFTDPFFTKEPVSTQQQKTINYISSSIQRNIVLTRPSWWFLGKCLSMKYRLLAMCWMHTIVIFSRLENDIAHALIAL